MKHKFLIIVILVIFITQTLILTTSCSNSYIKTFVVKDFPPYVDKVKVDEVFGDIIIKVEAEKTQKISDYKEIIKSVSIYGKKISKTVPLGIISKNGFIITNNQDISPNGFDKNSEFVQNLFIGFTSEVYTNSFILYGIVKNTNNSYYESDPLIIWDFDYDHKCLKVYSPNL